MKGTMPPIDAAIRPAFNACRPGSKRGAELRTPTDINMFTEASNDSQSFARIWKQFGKIKQINTSFSQAVLSVSGMWRPLISCLGVFSLQRTDSITRNNCHKASCVLLLISHTKSTLMTAETCRRKPESRAGFTRRSLVFLTLIASGQIYRSCSKHKIIFLTLKLAVGHQGATESDPSDVGAQVRHSLQYASGWVGVQVGILDHELSDAGENSCQPHEAVEGCHKLRQI